MALPSLFRERLEQMEDTRNHRLSLLQTERELQIIKSQLLSTKLSNIRSLEQCCLKFEQKIASRKFAISSLKAQMDSLDSNYDHILQQIRVSKNEVEELEELEKQKESFYGLERHKMERFQAQAENFVVDCQMQVQELEKQKESFYGLERHKMERFQAQAENFVVDCQMQVQELRNKINEVFPPCLSWSGQQNWCHWCDCHGCLIWF